MLRVFESFAGIGTQRMGLERAGIDHEVVGICEIDKFAIDSYKLYTEMLKIMVILAR